MVTVVRLLFGMCALVFFYLGSMFFGRGVAIRMNDPRPKHVIYVAFVVNTLLLVVFFTLWCVRVGIV